MGEGQTAIALAAIYQQSDRSPRLEVSDSLLNSLRKRNLLS